MSQRSGTRMKAAVLHNGRKSVRNESCTTWLVAEEGQENVQMLQKEGSEPCCSPHMKKEVHNIAKAQTDKKRNEQDASHCSSYHV